MIQAQIELLIIAAIVCIIISPFIANLCIDFKPRQSGIRNDVHYFDAPPPDSEHYKNCLISHGDIKNPQKN